MEYYITDSWAAGKILSMLPLGAAFFFFFFVEKKRQVSLLLYRFLWFEQNHGKKNKYPCPLLSSAFELLQGVTMFTKLHLRNSYHPLRIREGDEWNRIAGYAIWTQ